MTVLVCAQCKKENQIADRVGFREECLHCGSDLHSCKNCHHFETNSYNECKEPNAEVVQVKDRANYCEYYLMRMGVGQQAVNPAGELLSAAEALFKKS